MRVRYNTTTPRPSHGDGTRAISSASRSPRTSAESSRLTAFGVLALTALCFLWPAELPIAMFWHGVGYPIIGNAYVLLVHASLIVVAASSVIALGRGRIADGSGDWRWFAVASIGFVAVGVAPLVVSSITGVEPRFAYQDLCFGYLAPILFVTAALSRPLTDQQRLWTSFYVGWVVFLSLSLVVLFVSWRTATASMPQFASAPIAQQLILWRFTLGQPWNIYGVIMGNSNKLSNNLIVFLLLSVSLLGLEGPSRVRKGVLFLFWFLAVITLVVMFSRAAMLLLPFIVVASGVLGQVPKTPRRLAVACVVSGFAAAAIAVPGIFDYLFVAKFLPDSEANPLGTYNDRIEQWTQLATYMSSHTRESLVGLGTTGYGLRFFGQPELGTHNTFLDLWAQAGVVSPLVLLLTIASLAVQVFVGGKSARRKLVLAAGIVAIVLLMSREHSFSYLYVTSLGGLCLCALMYIAIAPEVLLAESRGQQKHDQTDKALS